MTITDIHERIKAIRACADDDERAHGMEDRLRADVLYAIACGELADVQALIGAALALTTSEIEFARWCA